MPPHTCLFGCASEQPKTRRQQKQVTKQSPHDIVAPCDVAHMGSRNKAEAEDPGVQSNMRKTTSSHHGRPKETTPEAAPRLEGARSRAGTEAEVTKRSRSQRSRNQRATKQPQDSVAHRAESKVRATKPTPRQSRCGRKASRHGEPARLGESGRSPGTNQAPPQQNRYEPRSDNVFNGGTQTLARACCSTEQTRQRSVYQHTEQAPHLQTATGPKQVPTRTAKRRALDVDSTTEGSQR